MKGIIDKRQDHMYKDACFTLFESVHPGADNTKNVGNHPNAFFDTSFEYKKAFDKRNKKEGNFY